MTDTHAVDTVEYWLSDCVDWISHINLQSVSDVLDGFPLESSKSVRWLTASVRRIHIFTRHEDIEAHPGHAAVRKELAEIIESLGTVRQILDRRSNWAESALRRYALIHAKNPDFSKSDVENWSGDWWGAGSRNLARIVPDWSKFREGVKSLEFLQDFAAEADKSYSLLPDPPRWRDSERRKDRVSFACQLSAVFEHAYGQDATLNNWTDEEGNPKLGNWPDFCERLGKLTLSLDRFPDLVGTLKAARKEYLISRAFYKRQILQ
jgi:hypothetical protein